MVPLGRRDVSGRARAGRVPQRQPRPGRRALLEEGGDPGLRLRRLPGVGEPLDRRLDRPPSSIRGAEAPRQPLGRGDRRRRRGEVGRDLGLDRRVEPVRRRHPRHQPERLRLGGVEGAAREEHRPRPPLAEPGDHVGRDRRRDDPEPGLGQREARRPRPPPPRRRRSSARRRRRRPRRSPGRSAASAACSSAPSIAASRRASAIRPARLAANCSRIQSRSPPAQKLGPAPVSTTTRTPGSAPSRAAAAASSSHIAPDSTLCFVRTAQRQPRDAAGVGLDGDRR